MFDPTRVQLDKILNKHKEYLRLYRYFNEGSNEGATSFAEFYWRFYYYSRYEEPEKATTMGY